MGKRYYIAYGSNLNVGQMRMRCPSARIIETSLISGYELLFKGSKTGAYLTIGKKEDGSIPVAVWVTTDADEAALDRYEGCPIFYYKTEMELSVTGIRTGKTRKRKGYIYIMHEDRDAGIPGSHYISTCAAGYRFFGFDEKYLQEALQRSWEDCHEK